LAVNARAAVSLKIKYSYHVGVSGTRWLDAEEQRAWRRLAAVAQLLPAAMDAQLQRDSGLTHFGYWVLAMLSEAPGRSMRMSELAARSTASASRLSHVVTKLECRGWVRRERATEDGRGNVAFLTDAGWQAVVAAAPGHVENVRQLVFDGLDREQLAALFEVCDRLLATLDPERHARLG
jgi:DNA-binding MarR family transcriptional regulator